jgi:hypothetical protein
MSMWKVARLSMLVGVLALLSLQARSRAVETITDIRCVVVGMRLTGMVNSPQHSAGMALVLYYTGRLDGRVPKLDIEDLLIKEISKMTNADYDSEAKRCEGGLTERGQSIAQIGKDMIERGQKMAAEPATSTK